MYIGNLSNRRGYYRFKWWVTWFIKTAQLREGLCAKVKLNVYRGGKMVNASTFAFQTNPTEQFNNFKT